MYGMTREKSVKHTKKKAQKGKVPAARLIYKYSEMFCIWMSWSTM